jgi:hypothetical protein
MIRFIVGLLVVFGAVGGMEDPAAPVIVLVFIAGIGLGLMYSGTEKMKQM